MMKSKSKSNLMLSTLLLLIVLVCLGFLTMSVEAKQLNKPPKGFVALFNGKDLTGWKGLVGSPKSRREMSKEELAKAQAKADEDMRINWKVVDGALFFNGKGHSLCTARDYSDFEMLVDWKIEKGGDSGIYLRGSPQVQIWDTSLRRVGAQVGSGGLYNNKKNPSKPDRVADRPVGQWNTFRIIMKGEKVTVYLNGIKVVNNVVMENYWERDKPIYPSEQIELQSHGSRLYFRNIFIREIKNKLTEQEEKDGFDLLFNGKDLTGWQGNTKGYVVKDGTISVEPELGGGNLYTAKEYGDFIMRFEFKLTPGANNGLGIRTPLNVNAAYEGMELQILDNTADKYNNLKPYQFHGSIYGVVPAKVGYLKPVGDWNYEEVIARGKQITVKLNGTTIVDADIKKASTPKTIDGNKHPGLKRKKGFIAFCGHGDKLAFRNLRIKTLK
ncbi:MAG: 3-keto-disaccharide hydrolase [Planctomycetota bacterium]